NLQRAQANRQVEHQMDGGMEIGTTVCDERQLLDDRHDQNQHERKRDEELPVQVHHLIDAYTRQGATNPHEDEVHREHLDEEGDKTNRPAPRLEALQAEETPATQVNRGEQRRHKEGGNELRQEEHAELHAAVFDVKAGDDLRLRFQQVKRRAARLGQGRNKEDDR